MGHLLSMPCYGLAKQPLSEQHTEESNYSLILYIPCEHRYRRQGWDTVRKTACLSPSACDNTRGTMIMAAHFSFNEFLQFDCM